MKNNILLLASLVSGVAVFASPLSARADDKDAHDSYQKPITKSYSQYESILRDTREDEQHTTIQRFEGHDAVALDLIVNEVRHINDTVGTSIDDLAHSSKKRDCRARNALEAEMSSIVGHIWGLDGPFAYGANQTMLPVNKAWNDFKTKCDDPKAGELAVRSTLIDLLGAVDDLSLDAGLARAFLDATAMSMNIAVTPDHTFRAHVSDGQDAKTTITAVYESNPKIISHGTEQKAL